MNKLKIAGRTNWSAGANNQPIFQVSVIQDYFILGEDESKIATSYVHRLHDIDGRSAGDVARYRQGYVNADPKNIIIVNQARDRNDFAAQGDYIADQKIRLSTMYLAFIIELSTMYLAFIEQGHSVKKLSKQEYWQINNR